MKRIILDQFRRWRGVLILIGSVYFLFAAVQKLRPLRSMHS